MASKQDRLRVGMEAKIVKFVEKVITYKLTDLKKKARNTLLRVAPDDTAVYKAYKAEKCLNPIWHDLAMAGWIFVDDNGNYQLTPDGLTLVREYYRSKVKKRWPARLWKPEYGRPIEFFEDTEHKETQDVG